MSKGIYTGLLFCAGTALAQMPTVPPRTKPLASKPVAAAPTPAPSSQPPTPATSLPVSAAPSLPIAVSPSKNAAVKLTNGQLTVQAENSSLNQILREVSRQTGTKLSGTVTDERVFGQYGPGRVSEVLSQLLRGTSSNMLYKEATPTSSAELVLTPRSGSVTSPSAFAATAPREESSDDNANFPPPPDVSPGPPQPQPDTMASPPQPDQASPATTPVPDNPATPANSNSTQNPNGVKTPQQLLQQLLQMRQQPGGSPNK